MRWKLTCNILGSVLVIIAFFMLVPLFFALLYQEDDIVAFLKAIAVTLICAEILILVSDNNKITRYHESFGIISAVWFTVSIFCSLPYIFYGLFDNIIDAVFESVSGITTTGSTVLPEIALQPHGIVLWRSMTHWIGGLGIVFLFTAISPFFKFKGNRMIISESTGPIYERLKPRIKETAKFLIGIYSGITILLILLLYCAGLSIFEALIHAFGAVSTGGFSSRGLSVMGLDNLTVEVILILFMIISSINFNLYYQLLTGKIYDFFHNREFIFYIKLVLVTAAFAAVYLRFSFYNSLSESLRYSFFQIGSILSTTGYVTADYDVWPPFIRLILFLLMFMGGCSGSTAGGIKAIRVILLLKRLKYSYYKFVNPKIIIVPRINGFRITEEMLYKATDFLVIYILIFITACLILTGTGLDIISASSAAVSSLGNVGPALGLVGPLNTYVTISDFGKLVLIFCMLLGRLEIYNILSFLTIPLRK